MEIALASGVAVGETVVLLHPPLFAVGVQQAWRGGVSKMG